MTVGKENLAANLGVQQLGEGQINLQTKLANLNNEQQVYVEYDSQAVHLATPLPPSETYNCLQDNSTNYYDVYNYQYVIYLFNIALQSSFDKLNSPPSQYAPVMTFDTVQNIAVINCDVAGYDISNPDSIQIFFNPASAVMFSSFPFLLINKIRNYITRQ